MGLVGSRDGSLWIGTASGLAHLVDNRLILYEKNAGWLVAHILEDKDGKIWIERQRADDPTHPLCQVVNTEILCFGSKDGVDMFDGTALIQDPSGDIWAGSTTALIFDNAGNLWLYSHCGLIEIPNEQVQLWWDHPESQLKMKVFDTLDGMEPGLGHFNTSTRTPDGRLWFANGNVLQEIDPAHIPENTLAPPVDISGRTTLIEASFEFVESSNLVVK